VGGGSPCRPGDGATEAALDVGFIPDGSGSVFDGRCSDEEGKGRGGAARKGKNVEEKGGDGDGATPFILTRRGGSRGEGAARGSHMAVRRMGWGWGGWRDGWAAAVGRQGTKGGDRRRAVALARRTGVTSWIKA
jgi:hypothetical protein